MPKINNAIKDGGSEERAVLIQISETKLLQLLKGGLLCASDMRCLDCESKHCLRRLVMKAGTYCMGR